MSLGLECTKRLRKIEESSGLQDSNRQLVIVCSANADEETSNLAYETGVDGFLEKPLNLKTFMKVYKTLKGPRRTAS